MIVKLLLDKKREGKELTRKEIYELIEGYTRGEVPDYQMSAFAMAVCCKGMTDSETLALTEAMRDSGTCLTWEGYPPTADKHSTGGVGDKLSLIVQPIAAACGLAVPSLTGRGLGLTGGTADKMESIPGYKAGISLDQYRKVVKECGCSLAMQTAEIAPADKKLYALRDVTGTVPSIPLITASILSKKLAEGAEILVFDVKCGSGAFMKTPKQAHDLAVSLVHFAKLAGRKAVALVTDMSQPLGRMVGNMCEVVEAYYFLKGESRSSDVFEVSIELAAYMVALAKGIAVDFARALCVKVLNSGEAFKCFEKMVKLHGGDLDKMLADSLDNAAYSVRKTSYGYVSRIDAECVAKAALELGAGRKQSGDKIDHKVGIRLEVQRGDYYQYFTPAFEVFAPMETLQNEKIMKNVDRLLWEALVLMSGKPKPRKMILEVVT